VGQGEVGQWVVGEKASGSGGVGQWVVGKSGTLGRRGKWDSGSQGKVIQRAEGCGAGGECTMGLPSGVSGIRGGGGVRGT
jgi:hypothetical protein